MTCLSDQQHGFKRILTASLILLGGAVCFLSAAYAQTLQQNLVTIKSQEGYRYIISNGMPVQDATGAASQQYSFRVSLKPREREKPGGVPANMFFGVAMDGVPFDSHAFNAQTDQYGGTIVEHKYVYADVPQILLQKDMSHIGYAADGVPIFYSKKNLFTSSYDENHTYVPGRGNLDICNGVTVNKTYYIYVLTGTYPKVPLCWTREPDASFFKSGEKPAASKSNGENPNAASFYNRKKSTAAMIKNNRKARSH